MSAIALALANTMPNVVLPACVGVEASLNLMTVICGGSGDGKSVCRKLAAGALRFWGVEEPFTFNPSSGQGVAGQYQYLKKERGLPPQMMRSRYRALAMVEESDTIAALASNPTSTLSSELRKAAMGESLGFGNVGETQTNLPEHSYRFVMMMCMQPDLAGWLLGDAAGGLPQRFVWACVRDPRVVRDVAHPGVMTITVDHRALPDPIAGVSRARHVMGVTDDIRNQIVEAAIQRKSRGEEAGQDFDGHALLARLKVAAGLSLLSGRVDILDSDWDLAGHIMVTSNATRAWVRQRVSDLSVKNNVAGARAKAHARIVEESVMEKQARAKASMKVLKWLSQAGADGLLKSKMREKLQVGERHLIDRGGDSILDGLLDTGQVHYVDVEHRGVKGSRWFIDLPPIQGS